MQRNERIKWKSFVSTPFESFFSCKQTSAYPETNGEDMYLRQERFLDLLKQTEKSISIMCTICSHYIKNKTL